jgi:hypothetical protein
MGLVNEFTLDNALYGHKTDLLAQLRENCVPNWLSPAYPRSYGGDVEITDDLPASTFLERWRDRAQARGRSQSVGFQLSPSPRTRVVKHGPRRSPPSNIDDRLRAFLESNRHQNELSYLRPGQWFEGFFVEVTVGARGGIQDIRVVAHYKD